MGKTALCLVGTILVCAAAVAQRRPLGETVTEPEIAVQGPRVKDEPLSVPQPKRDRAAEVAALKRDAETLAELAQTIPRGIEQAQKGVLSKDLLENLKRIEKLSRHLRHELSQ